MSSKIRIVKTCEYCKHKFIAKKTTTNTCSDVCAKRLYKFNQRNSKIDTSKLQTEIKRKPTAYIAEEQIKIINAKQYLNLKEAAFLMNVSQLTFRRWILSGKITSHKMGKKHLIEKSYLKRLF